HARVLITLRALLPHVGVVATGTFACDLAGTERVLGAPSRIARRILERLERIGAHASVGVALTPFAARVAADRTAPGETRLVTDAREYLTPLPLDVLPLDEKLRDELSLLGLRTVGDFAGLPRGAVFDRFGHGAARAHALARAEDEERVHADPPPRRIYARRLWEEPLASKEQLVFALRTARASPMPMRVFRNAPRNGRRSSRDASLRRPDPGTPRVGRRGAHAAAGRGSALHRRRGDAPLARRGGVVEGRASARLPHAAHRGRHGLRRVHRPRLGCQLAAARNGLGLPY